MSDESNLPEVLNELLYTNSESRRVQTTGNDLIHEALIEAFAKLPNSAFKWNWSKWRYDCVIDGNKVYATLSEYIGSRRLRIRDGKA